MKGSTTPVLFLALLVVGAAVYFALEPASMPVARVAGPTDATAERPAPDRTSTVPDAPPSPSRVTATVSPRGVVTVGTEGGSYANALVGEVKDDQGKAVEGAEVSAQKGPVHAFATYIQPTSTTGPVFRDRSSAEGKFRLPGLPPSESYLVRATHKDHPPVELTNVVVPAEGEVPLAIVFTSGYSLEGTVHDADRRALPQIELALESSAAGPFASPELKDRRTAKTDASGRYRFDNIPSGQRTLTASAPGFGSKTVPSIHFTGDTKTITQDLTLAEGKRIAGRVLDEAGNGISGARVEATAHATQEISRGEAESGPDGSFGVDGLAPGTYAVVASARGYSRETQPRVEAGSEGIEIRLGILGTVEGRVFENA
ncbi:MAG TPA: carboxypeptidase-like regulatory domain-containing protein, partial [Planctomycetota bacterium]|nr:carboxypeptidase-like regulatory domain-containing protein [Planctomycetota bacterium]